MASFMSQSLYHFVLGLVGLDLVANRRVTKPSQQSNGVPRQFAGDRWRQFSRDIIGV
jgi:hypothetical protein